LQDPVDQLFNWAARNEHALSVPNYLLDRAEHQHAAECNHKKIHVDHEGIQKSLEGHADRRHATLRIAEYVDDVYPDIAARLRACHNKATLFIRHRDDGTTSKEYIWDYKCGIKKLCPHCAHDAQRYFVDRYLVPINEWKNIDPLHQVQYCVLTWPNIEPGELKKMKKEMFKQVAAWLKRDVCESVKGSLVVMEDPLADDEKFNVHLNLVLLVGGRFDWKAARADWFGHTRSLFPDRYSGFNCHFQDVTKRDVTSSIMELIKYSAKHISSKDSNAPGLVDWPAYLFAEWWESQKKFRRVRSYGLLHSLHVYLWDRVWSEEQRREALATLQENVKLWFWKFRKLEKGLRDKLKELLIPPKPPADFSNGEFIGRVEFNYGRMFYDFYRSGPGPIDLILGHKSGMERVQTSAMGEANHHDPPSGVTRPAIPAGLT